MICYTRLKFLFLILIGCLNINYVDAQSIGIRIVNLGFKESGITNGLLDLINSLEERNDEINHLENTLGMSSKRLSTGILEIKKSILLKQAKRSEEMAESHERSKKGVEATNKIMAKGSYSNAAAKFLEAGSVEGIDYRERVILLKKARDLYEQADNEEGKKIAEEEIADVQKSMPKGWFTWFW